MAQSPIAASGALGPSADEIPIDTTGLFHHIKADNGVKVTPLTDFVFSVASDIPMPVTVDGVGIIAGQNQFVNPVEGTNMLLFDLNEPQFNGVHLVPNILAGPTGFAISIIGLLAVPPKGLRKLADALP